MNPRNVEGRIAKLEAQNSGRGEYLLIWRADSEPINDVVSKHGSGASKIICVEWLSDGPPPPPRWLKGGRHRDIPESELQAIDKATESRLAKLKVEHSGRGALCQRANGFANGPTHSNDRDRDRFGRMTDNELLYRIFGVPV